MRLADQIVRFLGRVELVLAGVDDALREGQEALAASEPMRARAQAKRILARLPDSPLGLALLADACDAAGLDAELALALEDLARRVPSQADVWVRLAHARAATGSASSEVRDALVRGLAVAEPGSEARKAALLSLADLDLSERNGARAELWLDRLPVDATSEPLAIRRAQARWLQGDAAGARALLERVENDPADGRAAMARGQILAALGDGEAITWLVRALVLEVPGASEALSSALGWLPSTPEMRARVAAAVDAAGQSELARFRAAFARAEGERGRALDALRDAVRAGDVSAAHPLLVGALEDGDVSALAEAVQALSAGTEGAGEPLASASAPVDTELADARALLATAVAARGTDGAPDAADPNAPPADDALSPESVAERLDRLRAVSTPRAARLRDARLRELLRVWVPKAAPSAWGPLLARLDAHARALSDLDAVARVGDLAILRTRPVRVAILGEFNAGKSTFINALMGEDVAPTGVLPTTATLHHLRYAPDPFARVVFGEGHEPPERIVSTGDLRSTLRGLASDDVRRVEILLPLESLTRIEVLDTPGFNAPDVRHAKAAREAFEEADYALFLLDATQALKQTEKSVLDEAKQAGLPLQILVNKVDRLSVADRARVMDLVVSSLSDLGITSQAPPLALSARLALAGKLGDAEALEASGWPDVQRLLDETLVARSASLKERALRRRAHALTNQLVTRARTLAEAEAEARARREAEAHTASRVAAALDRELDDVVATVARALEPSLLAVRRDMLVVAVGRDRAQLSADRTLTRYRSERALAHVAPPLARALKTLAEGTPLDETALLPLARALVRAASAAAEDLGDGSALARAATLTVVERLSSLAVAPQAPSHAEPLLRELDAIAEALA
jgi:small GTP-binding protein